MAQSKVCGINSIIFHQPGFPELRRSPCDWQNALQAAWIPTSLASLQNLTNTKPPPNIPGESKGPDPPQCHVYPPRNSRP